MLHSVWLGEIPLTDGVDGSCVPANGNQVPAGFKIADFLFFIERHAAAVLSSIVNHKSPI
jgi:hypothetical protein